MVDSKKREKWKKRVLLAHYNVQSLSLQQYARSLRVWWSDRAFGAIRLNNWSVCQQRDAPLHLLMKCASRTQCCFGATRRWWCDLSHVGPLRTLAPSSVATLFSVFILEVLVSQKGESSSSLSGCHHFAKASDCWGRRGDSESGQQQRTWAEVLSLRPHVEVWHVQRHHAQRNGSKTWSTPHRSGRDEVEALQFDRGGFDAARRGGVDVERATCPRPRCVFSVFFIDQENYLKRPDFIVCGSDCRASPSPEKARGVTGLLRRRPSWWIPRRIVEAWHVQRRHALRSGAFDNMSSRRFSIPPGSV